MKRQNHQWRIARHIAKLMLLAVFFVGCGKDNEPKPNQQDVIKKSWKIGSSGFVKKDAIDVSSEYVGLSITFSANGTYTTSGAKKMLFPDGTWAWQGTTATELVLDGDFPVTVLQLSTSTLHLQFNLQADDVNPNGRANAVVGDYEILLNEN